MMMKQTVLSILVASLTILSGCGSKDSSKEYSESEATSFEETSADNEEQSSYYSLPDNPQSDEQSSYDEEDYSSEEPDQPESDEESLGQKTKNLYHAAKDKYKEKKEEWREDHEDEIEERREKKQELKERGRELKNKTKEKVGGWLDRTRERLED